MGRTGWRTGIVATATILVITYCLGVIGHVYTSPDIGLQCTFSPVVARAFPEYLRSPENVSADDLIGDTIAQVGPYRIESWPQYQRVLRDLGRDARLPPPDNTVQDHDDERWILVQLRDSPDHPIKEVWCVLGHMPLESTVPALLWLVLEIGMFSVGALVFWKRPDDPAAGPFFALSIVAVGAYMGGYHWVQVVTQPVLLVVFVFSAVLVPAVTLHFQHVFPRPKAWLHRHRWLTLAGIYGVPFAMGLAVVGAAFWVRYAFRSGGTSAEVRSALMVVRWLVFAAFAVSGALYVAGTACLVHSYFRTNEPGERNQVKWILAGSLLATLPIAYSFLIALFRPLEF